MNTTQLIFATLAILCTSCAAFLMRVSTPHYLPSTSLMSRYHHNHHCLRMLIQNCNQIEYNDNADILLAEQSPSQPDDTSPTQHIRQNYIDINILSSSNTYYQHYKSEFNQITNRVCPALFSIIVSFVIAISLGVELAYASDNDIETNDNIKLSTFDSTPSVLVAENQEGQDLYVQLGPKVVLSEEERTIRKIVQSTQQQQQSEPTVILTNQKDRRSSSYKPKESPELKVILDDDSPSSLKGSASSPAVSTELKVELEKSTPKSISSSAAEQSTPSQNAKPLNMIELSDPKKAEVVTIRPQTIEYIKTYKATEKKSEQAKNDKGQEITVKSVSNDDAKKTNSKSKSVTIYEVFNNIKLFSLGLGVGTVAIMTYQKLNEIDTESGDYSNESDIPQQTHQGGMTGGSYLDSLNAASSSPETTLNRELTSLDKELTSLGEELTTLDKYLRDDDTTVDEGGEGNQIAAFDGVSCTAFKLDKLSMGEQARRIAEFEARQEDGDERV